MKLKQLTIHNIASIEDATIDFTKEPLADSKVFLITGNTGSGKSTILDAICLALYANTPRLKDSNMEGKLVDGSQKFEITDTFQLVRKGANKAFVTLTFTGIDGNDYEAKWHVERSTQGKQELKRKWTLKNLTHPEVKIDEGNGAQKVRGKDEAIYKAILQAVGLDFNQFCRTTMLAQGEFTRFLKSSDDEKAEILEKVTGTDIYSRIGKKVYEIWSEKHKIYTTAQEDINKTEEPSDEDVKNLTDRQIQIDSKIKELQDEKKKLDTKKTWLEKDNEFKLQEKNLIEEKRKAEEALQKDDYKNDKAIVNLWDQTNDVRRSLNDKKREEAEITNQNNKLNNYKRSYIRLLSGRAWLENEKKQLHNQLSEEAKKLSSEERNLTIDQLRDAQQDITKLEGKLDRAKDKIKTLIKTQKTYKKTGEKLQEQAEKIIQLNKEVEENTPKLEKAKSEKEKCEAAYNALKESVDDFAKTMRTNLKIGEVCPICGQEVTHDVPHDDFWQEKVDAAKGDFDKAKGDYEELDRKIRNWKADLNALNNYERDKQAHDNDRSVQDAEQAVIDICKNDCKLEEKLLSNPLDVVQLEEAINQKKQECNDKKMTLANVIRYQENINGIEDELDRVNEVHIEELMPGWTPETEIIEPIKMENLFKQMNDLRSKINSALDQRDSAQNKVNQAQQAIKKFLSEHTDITLECIEDVNKFSVETINQKRDACINKENAVSSKKDIYNTLLREIKNHNDQKPEGLTEEELSQSNDIIQILSDRIKEIENGEENSIASLNQEYGQIGQQLEVMGNTKRKLQLLREEKDRKKEEADRWGKLKELIGDKDGDDFKKIAQSYILANLITSANAYMTQLSDQFELHSVPGTFIIMLEDKYENKNEISWPTSVISGGEGFLVSLALALALSEISKNLRVDTLFIDEGFGTLSGGPLQRAIATLESLHEKAGRQVGIISHIEDLRERIPVKIQVEQEANLSSSKVTIVS